MTLDITTFDSADGDATALIDQLRGRLSPQGDIVSDAGRARTIELFGEALAPQEVVQRICDDVAQNGLEAVLDYTRRLDSDNCPLDRSKCHYTPGASALLWHAA